MNNLLLTVNNSQFTEKNTVNRETTTQNSKGFTLLELLVVLAIVGILTGIGTFAFQAAQVRARDGQRKSDLAVIASALEKYHSKNKSYPDSCGGWCRSDSANPWIPALTADYIDNLPKDIRNFDGPGGICDPRNSAADNANADLVYGFFSNNTQFILSAKLENDNDPDIGKQIEFEGTSYSNHGCYAVTSP